MIAIVNNGPHDDPDPAGWRNYEVITTFRHRREHGLARCLKVAANAVADVRVKELQAYLGEEKNG